MCADFDGSGTVDVGDLTAIAGRWDQTSSSPGWNRRYDLFPTNRIDMLDLMWATSQWDRRLFLGEAWKEETSARSHTMLASYATRP